MTVAMTMTMTLYVNALMFQTEYKRLDGVFGDCDDDGSFQEYYGFKYTMPVSASVTSHSTPCR